MGRRDHEGARTCHAVNRAKNKEKLFHDGIGLIQESETDKRGILVGEVIGYMAKSDLYLQSKSFKGQKLFRIGRAPEPPEEGPGRPRKPFSKKRDAAIGAIRNIQEECGYPAGSPLI